MKKHIHKSIKRKKGGRKRDAVNKMFLGMGATSFK